MTVMDRFRLDGDVALVTGAAGGIGGALSEAVAEAGADVAIVDVNEEGLEDHAAHLESSTEAAVESVVADVSDEDANERMVEQTVDALGDLDIAFANAGIGLRGGSAAEYDMDDWDQLMSINLRGAFLTDRAAAGYMVDNGGGRIVNTASILGVNGTMFEGLSAYVAAKGGVVQITRQLAGELGHQGVRVNAIAPGFIETAMTEEGMDAGSEAFLRQIPLGRIGQPEDLKGIGVYLASEASPYTTGEIVLVDGGLNAV